MGHGTVKVQVAALLTKLGVSGRTAAAVVGAKFLTDSTSPSRLAKTSGIIRSHSFVATNIGTAA